jgi:hypothetical protein
VSHIRARSGGSSGIVGVAVPTGPAAGGQHSASFSGGTAPTSVQIGGASGNQYGSPSLGAAAAAQQQQQIQLTSNDPALTRFGFPEDDLPLLEELGIHPQTILAKSRLVLHPFGAMSGLVLRGGGPGHRSQLSGGSHSSGRGGAASPSGSHSHAPTSLHEIMDDGDLAGPLVFAMLLGAMLILQGKIHFGAIYGLSVCGTIFGYFLLSMLADVSVNVRLPLVISTLGYCLLPNLVLALVSIAHLWIVGQAGSGFFMLVATSVAIFWSAYCAMRIFAEALNMQERRYLVLYPALLFYAVFAAITIF